MRELDILQEIWSDLSKESQKLISLQTLRKTILDPEISNSQRRNSLARGIINIRCRNNLLLTGLKEKTINNILLTWLDKWMIVFQDHIWRPRCETTIEWEKLNNINPKQKREKKEGRRGKKKKKKKLKEILTKSPEAPHGTKNIKRKGFLNFKEEECLEFTIKEIKRWIEVGVSSWWNLI